MNLINIGFGKMVNQHRVIGIVSPDAAPIKRLIKAAKAAEQLEDATQGRKTRAVIIMEDGRITLSALQPETIGRRAVSGISGLIDDSETRAEAS